MVSSEIGKGRATSPSPSAGTCSYSGSMTEPAPTRPMIGTEFSSRYSVIRGISAALISRCPPRISETAPGRTPMARARPPFVFPGFSRARSIMATSNMAPNLRCESDGASYVSDNQNSSLTFRSEYRKLSRSGAKAQWRCRPGPPHADEEAKMQSTDWPDQHSMVLRDLHAKGLSYAEIARALNAQFGTTYTRNATLGRGKRMGLAPVVRQAARAPEPRPRSVAAGTGGRAADPATRDQVVRPEIGRASW